MNRPILIFLFAATSTSILACGAAETDEASIQQRLGGLAGAINGGRGAFMSAGGSNQQGVVGGECPPGTEAAPIRDLACAEPEQGLIPLDTAEQVKALLPGRWLLCSDINILDATAVESLRSDAAGIEFDADGTWAYLYRDRVSGSLTKADAFGKAGGWGLIQYGPGDYAAELLLNTGGEDQGRLSFAVAPQKMHMPSFSGVHDYVRAPSEPQGGAL